MVEVDSGLSLVSNRWRVRCLLDEFEILLDGHPVSDDARKESQEGVECLLRGRHDRGVSRALFEVYAALRSQPVNAIERQRDAWFFERALERELSSATSIGRMLVRKLAPPDPGRQGPPEPPAAGPAPKAVPPDKFIRILLFDAAGAAWGPPSANVDLHLQDQSTFELALSGGTAEKTGIAGVKPSACTLEFTGVADASDSVPEEAKPVVEKAGAAQVLRRALVKDQLFDGCLNTNNLFQLQRLEADALELEHFADGGVILWPGAPPETTAFVAGAVDGAATVLGIDALRAALEMVGGNAPESVVVTGHGAGVSQQRADGVKALLVGDEGARGTWVDLALGGGTVADQQSVLRWAAAEFAWPCDPGDVDGVLGPHTKNGVRGFQRAYNADHAAGLFPIAGEAAALAVDGVVGRHTYGAMFDCYQRAVLGSPSPDAPLTSSAPADLASVGCGTHHLTTPFAAAEDRRTTTRAVEVILLDAGDDPIVCTADSGDPCTARTCQLYDPREYAFTYVPVTEGEQPLISIEFFDPYGAPIYGAPYQIEGDGIGKSGIVDSAVAVIEGDALPETCVARWSRPDADRLAEDPDVQLDAFEFERTVYLDLEPAAGPATASGNEAARRRLSNLGYAAGDLAISVQLFQRVCGLSETGALADASDELLLRHDRCEPPILSDASSSGESSSSPSATA